MRIKGTWLVQCLGLVLFALTLTACGGGDSGSAPPTLVSISINPGNPSVAKGVAQQFTATGVYSNSSTANLTSTVTWSSATPSVATVSAAGLAATLGVGSAVITAKSGSLSTSTTLSVTSAILKSISVTPTNPSVALGITEQFKATGVYTDSSTADLTNSAAWSSATPTVATVNAAGLATTIKTGSSIITATSGSISGSTTLTVTPTVLESISITPNPAFTGIGITLPLSATGKYSNGTLQNLTTTAAWTSSASTVASVGGSTGVVTGTSLGFDNHHRGGGNDRGNGLLVRSRQSVGYNGKHVHTKIQAHLHLASRWQCAGGWWIHRDRRDLQSSCGYLDADRKPKF